MNTLADFPSCSFAIIAHCRCGHSGRVDRSGLPADLSTSVMEGLLRCSKCGARAAEIRILWTAAGGYAHAG
jgi:hypothetical protein